MSNHAYLLVKLMQNIGRHFRKALRFFEYITEQRTLHKTNKLGPLDFFDIRKISIFVSNKRNQIEPLFSFSLWRRMAINK